MASDFDKELNIEIILNDKEVKDRIENVNESVGTMHESVDRLQELWATWDSMIEDTNTRLTEVVETMNNAEGKEGGAFGKTEEVVKSLVENFEKVKAKTTEVAKASSVAMTTVKTGATTGAVAVNTLGASVGLARTAFQALWATISANPIGILMVAIGALIPMYEFLSDLFEDSSKKALENAEALKRLTAEKEQLVSAQGEERESTLRVLQEYEKIKKGTSELKEGTDEYKDVMQDASVVLWEHADVNNNVSISEEELAEKIAEVKRQSELYKKETSELNEKLVDLELTVNRIKFDALIEEFEDLRTSGEAWYETVLRLANPVELAKDTAITNLFEGVQKSLKEATTLKEAEVLKQQLIEMTGAWYDSGEVSGEAAQKMLDAVNNQFEVTRKKLQIYANDSEQTAMQIYKNFQKQADIENKDSLEKQLEWVKEAKRELEGEVKSDQKSMRLGFAPALETDESIAEILKQLDKKEKAIEREIKARERLTNAEIKERERLERQRKRDRVSKMQEFSEDIKLIEGKLAQEKITYDEYRVLLGEIEDRYTAHVKTLTDAKEELTLSEENFPLVVKNSAEKIHEIQVEAFGREADLRNSQMALQTEYNDADRTFYEDLLRRYEKFVEESGTNADIEIEMMNYLILKLRELAEARLDATVSTPLDKELKQIGLDEAKDNLATSQIVDPKKKAERQLAVDEFYNNKRLELYKKYTKELEVAPEGETEEEKKVREEMLVDMQTKTLNMEADITNTQLSEKEKRIEATRDEWENRFAIASQGFNQLASIAGAFFQMEDERVTKRVAKWLEAQFEMLDAEYSRAKQHVRTQRQQERLDEEFAKKEEELRKEAEEKRYAELKFWFDLEKAMNIASAIANTAVGVTQAWAQGGAIFGPILAGIVAAAGAVQVAMIQSQEMPEAGFFEGGYTGGIPKNKIAGVVHGQEFVVNAKATRKYRKDLEKMNAEQLPEFYNGGFVESRNYNSNYNINRDNSELENLISKNNKLLEQYLKTPVPAVLDKNQAKKITQAGIQFYKRSNV